MSNLELGNKRAKELGLALVNIKGMHPLYIAEDIHQLLGEGVEAIGRKTLGLRLGRGENDSWVFYDAKTNGKSSDTHISLIIGIRPTVQATREEQMETLLRMVVDRNGVAHIPTGEWIDAVHRLLERKDE